MAMLCVIYIPASLPSASDNGDETKDFENLECKQNSPASEGKANDNEGLSSVEECADNEDAGISIDVSLSTTPLLPRVVGKPDPEQQELDTLGTPQVTLCATAVKPASSKPKAGQLSSSPENSVTDFQQPTSRPNDDGVCTDKEDVAKVESNTDKSKENEDDDSLSNFMMPDLVVEEFSLEEALGMILDELNIKHEMWTQTDDYLYWQVQFVVTTDQCDQVVRRLASFGIGTIKNTSMSLFPATYHGGCISPLDQYEDASKAHTDPEPVKTVDFFSSVKSRLIVAQVVEEVRRSASLTFDFVMFVILASIIASLALAENSSVVLVASMLVSPIMGPILGGTFGIVIKHRSLWKLGLLNELVALTICILCGFVMGILTGVVSAEGAMWGSTDSWPTDEMKSRGLTRSLWVGVLIALPSGAGVALSILGGNAGSLVGVAISASLLPPAVNAGMLWAYALISSWKPPPLKSSSARTDGLYEATTLLPTSATELNLTGDVSLGQSLPPGSATPVPPNCPLLESNTYQFVYSCFMPREAATLGTVSLLLTMLNIVCIILMGVLVLKIKEVAPDKAVPEFCRTFWKKDIKVAREAYSTLKPTNNMTKQIAAEIKERKRKQTRNLSQVNFSARRSLDNILLLIGQSEDYQAVQNYLTVRTPLKKQFSQDGSQTELQELFSIASPASTATRTARAHFFEPDDEHDDLKEAKFSSPTGQGKFFYHPEHMNQRLRRKRLQQQMSVPHDLKLSKMKRDTSTGRFTVTTIEED